MDLMELGANGELVGGAAVVASLLYVGVQARHSNKLAPAETVRSFLHEYNLPFYENRPVRVGKTSHLHEAPYLPRGRSGLGRGPARRCRQRTRRSL